MTPFVQKQYTKEVSNKANESMKTLFKKQLTIGKSPTKIKPNND